MKLNETIAFNVKFYRKQKGMNQKEFAEKCGFSSSLLTKLETGKLEFSREHINSAAFALSLPASALLKPFLVPERGYFRATKKMKDGVLVLNQAERWVRHYHFLENILDCQRAFVFDRPELPDDSAASIFAYAGEVRKAFGLDDMEPVQNLCNLVEDIGIKLLFLDNPSDGFFGFSLLDPADIPAIVVNTYPKITVERQIFSLAHELGHILLHLSAFALCQDIQSQETPEVEKRENEADMFAGAFLLPEKGFRQEWDRSSGLRFYDRVICVKQKFQVSHSAVLKRLVQLKMADNDVFMKFKAIYKQRNNGRSLEKGREPMPMQRSCSFKANRFRNLVFQALKANEITISKAAEMLQKPVEDVLNILQEEN